MSKYRCVNYDDGNKGFELDATGKLAAYQEALERIGYYVSCPVSVKQVKTATHRAVKNKTKKPDFAP
jgi:hypothetical protein